MGKVMGRPPLPPGKKKVKINVALDPEVFQFLETVDNRSSFINKAAKILIKATQNAAARK